VTDEPAVPDVEVPLYLRMLWHGEDSSRPGPKRGVDLTTIADAGVRIADAEGLAALSMRRLATELGFTPMALYRYVESKSDVLALILDRAYGLPPALGETDDWRVRMTTWGTGTRNVILAHPWILQIPVVEPPLTPGQISWMEAGLDALAATPLGEQEKLSSMLLIDVYIRGQSQLSLAMNPGGQDSPEAAMAWSRRLRALIDQDKFPRLRAAMLSGALDDDDTDFATDEFRFGLDSVLDGISARIDRRLASRRAETPPA
jgi:AcrR family transcriptional regulator